jgi:3-hydroxyisobutyrate dehydrogenase-like beta-hydroxyacid dehydrogenase
VESAREQTIGFAGLGLMLADSPAVEQVVGAEDGVLDGIRPGSLLIERGDGDLNRSALVREIRARS